MVAPRRPRGAWKGALLRHGNLDQFRRKKTSGNAHGRPPSQPDRRKRRWRPRAGRDRAARGGGAVLAELARAVKHDLATPDHAPATERAYAHDWADFAAFCGRHGLAPLPAAPQTLALYLKALETQRTRSPAGLAAGTIGLSLPTLRRRLAAIASRHATAGFETPTEHSLVRRLLRRYSRARGTAVRKKEPLLIEQLPAILTAMPTTSRRYAIGHLLLLG